MFFPALNKLDTFRDEANVYIKIQCSFLDDCLNFPFLLVYYYDHKP